MRSRVWRRTSAIVCVLVLVFVTVCSCGSKEAVGPEKMMDAFYRLLIYQDIEPIVKLGVDQEEAKETLSDYRETMTAAIQKQFSAADISISQTQAEDILDEMRGALKKLDYKVTVEEQSGKKASVQIASESIPYQDIFKNASDKTIRELEPRHIEKLSDAKDLLVTNVKEGFRNVKPSSSKRKKTFELKKKKIKSGKNTLHVFFPVDAEEMGSQIMNLAIGKS